MIYYSNEGGGPFGSQVLLHWRGSVLPKSMCFTIPSITLAVVLRYLKDDDFEDNEWGADSIKASQLWGALGAVLTFMITFRTNKAYARFWDGTTLLHQMWGEWFDASSCLVAFSTLALKTKREAVEDFRHTLIRLMSLCHASALEEIALIGEEEQGYPVLDLGGLDESSLVYLCRIKDDKKLGFNRVEVIIHMIQTLVVNAQESGCVKIPPPILSRVFQTISRGQVNLANCKKMTSTLYPFPYAQLTAFLMVVFGVLTPFLMSSIVDDIYWVGVFAGLPVFGLYALNYIARELEMPFGDDPNDLPLEEFQDRMNSSLLMLIREEADHVCHASLSVIKDYDKLRSSISTKRPSDFVSRSTLWNKKISLIPPSTPEVELDPVAAPAAAPPAPKAESPPLQPQVPSGALPLVTESSPVRSPADALTASVDPGNIRYTLRFVNQSGTNFQPEALSMDAVKKYKEAWS